MIDTSIIIPIFQESNYLAGLLENLVRQSHAFRTEIILCEYKSDGKSARIIQAFHEVYPNQKIRLVEVADKGIVRARDEGIQLSSGQIIVNMDADCIFSDSQCIEKLIEPIIEGEAVLTFCLGLLDEKEAKTSEQLKKIQLENALTTTRWLPVLIPGTCIRKDVYFECGGLPFDKDPFEMGYFIPQVYIRYPNGIKNVRDAAVIASPRRLLKEKELGVVEHGFRRTSAVREGRIIKGNYDEFEAMFGKWL